MPSSTTPFDIAHAKQFFPDLSMLAEHDGVQLEMNPPQKAGPVMVPENPWEEYRICVDSIVEDDGVYKMWYTASPCVEPIDGTRDCPRCKDANAGTELLCLKCGWPLVGEDIMAELFLACYAESTDGINWQRPNLGLYEFRGSTDNNILPQRMFPPALNPLGGDDEKFMAICEVGRKLYITVSPDGIHWTRNEEPMLPFAADTNNQVIYDPLLGKYVAFLRGFPRKRTTVRAEADNLHETPWPYEHVPRDADITGTTYLEHELDTVMDVDELDPEIPGLDVNHISMTRYADGLYVGFPGMFRSYPATIDRTGRENHKYFAQGNDGTFETQLAVSRDGRTWSRPDRRPYINSGLYGIDDDGGLVMAEPAMITRGHHVYQYYNGSKTTHAVFCPAREKHDCAVYRLIQTRDRFISLSSGTGEGSFVTKPLVHDGSTLKLNIDCAGLGETFVEIQDESGKAIEGFTLADCDPIDLNRLDITVTWRMSSDVSQLRGKPIRLKFQMRGSKLFTFEFAD